MQSNLTLNVLVDNAPVVKVFYSLANLKPVKHGFCNWQPPFHRIFHVIVQGVIWRAKDTDLEKSTFHYCISQNNTTGWVFFSFFTNRVQFKSFMHKQWLFPSMMLCKISSGENTWCDTQIDLHEGMAQNESYRNRNWQSPVDNIVDTLRPLKTQLIHHVIPLNGVAMQ